MAADSVSDYTKGGNKRPQTEASDWKHKPVDTYCICVRDITVHWLLLYYSTFLCSAKSKLPSALVCMLSLQGNRCLNFSLTLWNTHSFTQITKAGPESPECNHWSFHTFQGGSVGQEDHLLCNCFSSGVVVNVLEQKGADLSNCWKMHKSCKSWVCLTAAHQVTGHIWHWILVAILNWLPCKHHVDGAGVHQSGDAPLLTHWNRAKCFHWNVYMLVP